MCGEKNKLSDLAQIIIGSPPRVRGKVRLFGLSGLIFGITPACAGKSSALWQYRTSRRDHPRVCGEKIRGYVKIWNEWGSPPRVRGKACWIAPRVFRPRITPACAGKRRRTCGPCGCPKDHPRVCGEKETPWSSCALPRGSPPRVRGKGSPNGLFGSRSGITPACAGKSCSS